MIYHFQSMNNCSCNPELSIDASGHSVSLLSDDRHRPEDVRPSLLESGRLIFLRMETLMRDSAGNI